MEVTILRLENTHQVAFASVKSIHESTDKKEKKIFLGWLYATLIKKKAKFSSDIRKFRWEQLQSHIWGRAS